ncbi:MAG TPA: hypothetical protein ENG63_06815 [Candidatus Desulfofervidus auxilii]|uniref:Uncharacterized protein n=1 Tax=Desulfofervidus auxilii TaxID=1621989 RepID=A0A7C0YAG6_DESA2|nr:hypothetical protein [Candidatus Desulfofervidus auxilii]
MAYKSKNGSANKSHERTKRTTSPPFIIQDKNDTIKNIIKISPNINEGLDLYLGAKIEERKADITNGK